MSKLSRFIHFYTDEDDGNGGGSGVLKTIKAALVHITDALAKQLDKCEVTLEPKQDLHGQDAPYPSGGGVNKLPPTSSETLEQNGMTCKTDGGGVFTFTGTLSGTYNKTFSDIPIQYTIQSGDYFYCFNSIASTACQIIVNLTDNTTIGITLSPINKRQSLSSYVGKTVKSIRFYMAATYNGTVSPMIAASDSATSFAPYSNICPITGHTGVNVVRTGKNLWDNDSSLVKLITYQIGSGAVTTKGGYEIIVPTGTYTAKAIPKDPSTTSGYIYGGVADANNHIDTSQNLVIGSSFNTQTLTVSEGQKILYLAAARSASAADALVDLEKFDFVLEVGSTAGDYESYQGETYEVKFPPLGKNICLDVGWTQGQIGADGSQYSEAYAISSPFILLSAGTYTLSREYTNPSADGQMAYHTYDLEKNHLQDSGWQNNPSTFTLDTDRYIRITTRRNTTDALSPSAINNSLFVQLEPGSSATSYEQYIPVYSGTIDLVTGKLIVDRQLVTKTLSEGAPTIGEVLDSYWFYNIFPYNTTGSSDSKNKICNIAKYAYASADSGYTHFYASTSVFIVYVPHGTDSSLQVQVCVPIATPIEYDLTPQQITALLGENNIWSDGTEVEVTYKAVSA